MSGAGTTVESSAAPETPFKAKFKVIWRACSLARLALGEVG